MPRKARKRKYRPRPFPEYIEKDGKIYALHDVTRKKPRANATAKALKNKGYLVRVIPRKRKTGTYHCVYSTKMITKYTKKYAYPSKYN